MTQIIERVARAIFEKNTGLTWPTRSDVVKDHYRGVAQAALEEIKFEQLVGALEGLLGALGANRPEEELVTDFGMLGLDNINRTQALLSELEKTDA